MKRPFVRYPGTVMLILAAVYVLLRRDLTNPIQVFAMLALTAIGATELCLAILAVAGARATRRDAIHHALIGLGAAGMGYALLGTLDGVVFTAGALAFAFGMIMVTRRLRLEAKST